MTILAEATVVVKPVAVTLPWAWGFQDGATGVSWAEGYGLFAGERLAQYLAGHKVGKAAAARKAIRTAQVAPASDPALVQWRAEGSPAPANWFTRPDSEYAQMDAEMRPLNIERW